jgi:hypothetical protein
MVLTFAEVAVHKVSVRFLAQPAFVFPADPADRFLSVQRAGRPAAARRCCALAFPMLFAE